MLDRDLLGIIEPRSERPQQNQFENRNKQFDMIFGEYSLNPMKFH